MRRVGGDYAGLNGGQFERATKLLAGAGSLALVGLVSTELINAPELRAQSSAPERFEFESASVKPHRPGDTQVAYPSFSPGGRFTSRGMPVIMIIALAYDLPIQGSQRLLGGPNWIRSMDTVYDIEAAPPQGVFPDGLSYKVRLERMRSMLQALLAERFKIAIHREAREMPVYVLVIGKNGLKLPRANLDGEACEEPGTPPGDPLSRRLKPGAPGRSDQQVCHAVSGGRGRGLHARAANMSDLVSKVEAWTDRPLLDKTGLKGLYKIETGPWLPMELGASPPSPGARQDGVDVADLPTLFTIFERLGLKMESQKAKADVYIIDRVQRPTVE